MRHGWECVRFYCLFSIAVESMNKANKDMRARMTVNLFNATMLLIKLEYVRFDKIKQEAWCGGSVITTQGKEEYNATCISLLPSNFIFHVRDYNDH